MASSVIFILCSFVFVLPKVSFPLNVYPSQPNVSLILAFLFILLSYILSPSLPLLVTHPCHLVTTSITLSPLPCHPISSPCLSLSLSPSAHKLPVNLCAPLFTPSKTPTPSARALAPRLGTWGRAARVRRGRPGVPSPLQRGTSPSTLMSSFKFLRTNPVLLLSVNTLALPPPCTLLPPLRPSLTASHVAFCE